MSRAVSEVKRDGRRGGRHFQFSLRAPRRRGKASPELQMRFDFPIANYRRRGHVPACAEPAPGPVGSLPDVRRIPFKVMMQCWL